MSLAPLSTTGAQSLPAVSYGTRGDLLVLDQILAFATYCPATHLKRAMCQSSDR